MLVQKYKDMLSGKSVIRQLSEFAAARGAEIGYENVFDYSLGNPSVPAPRDFTDRMIHLLATREPVELHGYSPSLGITQVREAVAVSLEKRFGIPYRKEHIFMTSGAAGALAHAIRLVAQPGDEILTFAPFFPEYHPYVDLTGAVLRVVPPDTERFQINFEAFEELLGEKTAAILINTPNNPSGVVYSTATLERLTDILRKKQKEYGHEIYLISDEPYRELAYDGVEVPYVTKYYANTIVGYSYSKSLSLPGERIGYLVIPDEADDFENLVSACNVATRILGFVNAPSLQQLVIQKCLDETSDISVYDKNRELLYNSLTEYGFECIKPQGAFYLFVKCPIDETQFVEKAKQLRLLLVGGKSFACEGYVRLAYCVSYDTIVNSLPQFRQLAKETLNK